MAFLSSTWAALWADCYAVARRPLSGICLPQEEATQVSRGVFQALLGNKSTLSPLPKMVEFLRLHARKISLASVAAARQKSNAPALWTETKEGAATPSVLLHHLQQNDAATDAWKFTIAAFRQHSWNTIKCQGVPQEEIDDVLSETLLDLFRPRADGVTRPLDTLLVYEELLPFLNTMAKNVATDFMRARGAQKRLPKNGGFVGGEAAENVAGPNLAPGEAYSFHQCYQECRDCLSEFQWNLLMRLYVLESTNRLQLIEEPAVLHELSLKSASSAATRRRRLNDYLDSMVNTLARYIRLP